MSLTSKRSRMAKVVSPTTSMTTVKNILYSKTITPARESADGETPDKAIEAGVTFGAGLAAADGDLEDVLQRVVMNPPDIF